MKGIATIQHLKQYISSNIISSNNIISDEQIQPNSLDLRVGNIAYRVRSSFISEHKFVQEKIDKMLMYELDLTNGAVLEKGKVYIIPLQEYLSLPLGIHGSTNPKSSTGRLDIFTRVITDFNYRFNEIPDNYKGKLYLEIAPRSFTIKIQEGETLSQLRLISEDQCTLLDKDLLKCFQESPLLYDDLGRPLQQENVKFKDGLFMGVDLKGHGGNSVIGYKSRKNSGVIDLSNVNYYPIEEFWEPIHANKNNGIILEPEEFYIFSSKERIWIPSHICGEMVPYDTNSGELRTHYAGFFDSGFGEGTPRGAKVVLEIRSHDVPFFIEDGQTLFRIVFNQNCSLPDKLYGANVNSSYQGQGLKLAKQFIHSN